MVDTGIFGVANIGAVSLEGGKHLAGVFDGDVIVAATMENPNGSLADLGGHFGVACGNVGVGMLGDFGKILR